MITSIHMKILLTGYVSLILCSTTVATTSYSDTTVTEDAVYAVTRYPQSTHRGTPTCSNHSGTVLYEIYTAGQEELYAYLYFFDITNKLHSCWGHFTKNVMLGWPSSETVHANICIQILHKHAMIAELLQPSEPHLNFKMATCSISRAYSLHNCSTTIMHKFTHYYIT